MGQVIGPDSGYGGCHYRTAWDALVMAERPTGTVTFLFTDIQGSTRLWEQHPTEMRVALERHDEILRSAIESLGGYVFSTAGDAFAAAFARVSDGLSAAGEIQEHARAEAWPESTPISVRMGLHVGEAQERGGDYFGSAVNTAARVMSAGHGGQLLVSSAVASLIDLHDAVDLGEHRLKDLTAAQRLWQVGSGDFPPLRTLDTVRTNLPVERTALVGRKAEIGEVADLLDDHRLVTLLGIGGTGKTRLATAVAAEVADQFADGVWFVDLVPAAHADQVAETVATALGLQIGGTDLVGALGELLADRDVLVVLDNCEHITDEVADVVDVLMERTTSPRFLATSREPMQLPDERQVQVPPLEVAEDLASPAVELFVRAAERIGVSLSSDDVVIVAEICSQLDGLPLSVELAAAQLRQLSLDELASRLEQRFELLARGRRRRGRQASLLAVLEDTWAMLHQSEIELLVQLAAFPASFSADDVEGIAAGLDVTAPTRTLAGLVDLGLVARTADERHRLLETVKLFARQQWAQSTDPDAYFERHTTWALEHLGSLERHEWYTSLDVAAWANSHYLDLRAIEDRLAHAGRTHELASLLGALTLSYTYGTGTRASAVIERIELYLDQLQLSDHESGLLNLVAASAGLPARRSDWMDRGGTAAVTLLRVDGAPEDLAAALVVCSWMTVFRDFDTAVGMLEEARSTADAVNAPALADVATAYLAGHHALVGRVDESAQILAGLHVRLTGRPMDYAGTLDGLFTMAAGIVKEPEMARAVGQDVSDALDRPAGDFGPGFGIDICNCVAAAVCGDIAQTRELVFAAKDAARRANNDDGLPDLLIPPAALAWKLDQVEVASRLLTAVRRSSKQTQSFHITLMYRLLRNEVGLLDDNPLDTATIEEIYAQAVEWMDSA